jgi:hypothetical protein
MDRHVSIRLLEVPRRAKPRKAPFYPRLEIRRHETMHLFSRCPEKAQALDPRRAETIWTSSRFRSPTPDRPNDHKRDEDLARQLFERSQPISKSVSDETRSNLYGPVFNR